MFNLFKSNKLSSVITVIDIGSCKITCLIAKINEQKDRLSYKDKVIEKAKKINKQLNEKLNKLNYKSIYCKKITNDKKGDMLVNLDILKKYI